MQKNNGFTLLELLTTIAIMSIVLALGISYLNSGKYILRKETLRIYSKLQKARSFAIRFKQTESVGFNVSTQSFSLNFITDTTTFSKTVKLSDKIEYGDGGHGTTSYHTVKFGAGATATFYPNGYCTPSGSVYLKTKSSNDYVYRIKVTIAGNIQILKWNGSKWTE